jgi:hypothetical protein
MLAPNRERRAHRRVPLTSEVRLTSKAGTYVTRAKNISVGGLGFRRVEGVRQGEELNVEISLGLGRTFATRAQLTWARDADAGARFLELDQRALVALIGFVGRAS